eukprot:Partr_v1_DN23963_c0_g1_i1_m49010 putative sepiapterin reductase (7,8-dihydrobiopterin NADP oxidoreductase)
MDRSSNIFLLAIIIALELGKKMKAQIVITGASRGFGKQIALTALNSLEPFDHLEFSLYASSTGSALKELALELGELDSRKRVKDIQSHAIDFSHMDGDQLERLISASLHHAAETEFDHVFIFNNAGTLGPLVPLIQSDATSIQRAFQVNIVSPTLFTKLCLNHLKHSTASVHLINISSLAAVQPFNCWSIYCTGRAARDMLHRCVAAEMPQVRVLNYAPGPLDTDMQREIREKMPAESELRKQFVDMHDQGKLVHPRDSASKLWQIIQSDTYSNGDHIDYFDTL